MTCDRYCCVAAAEWYRVLAQSEAGVTVDPRQLTSEVLWNGPAVEATTDVDPRFIPWHELDVPLPHRGARCWGYALTYPEHKRETLDSAHFRFLKKGTVEANSAPIPYRDFLDYELEIGVLLHRDTPDRFGYFLANDLTDRGLQIEHYDARNPGPGFTIAKEFAGSLRAGPLLSVGDASLWRHLTATLTLNGVDRQIVRAIDCHLHPRLLHDELFRDHEGDPWLLAATGTSGGTLFRSPRPREKVKVLVAGGLSMKRARRKWLTGLKYLSHGDTLVIQSSILGRSETRVE
jgi:2-keto-4-pentenoate hydratase/2-oxohepta-3-ene-1,7-dioic acid hydratase in catechol pathway